MNEKENVSDYYRNKYLELQQENKQLKEKIVKVRKHIEALKEFDEANFGEGAYSKDWEELLEILKGSDDLSK